MSLVAGMSATVRSGSGGQRAHEGRLGGPSLFIVIGLSRVQ